MSMFHVKTMSADDFTFATELANTMNWHMAVEDFEFLTALEPEGCFVALHDGERVGIATSISYGSVGWFGNLIVEEKYRSRGVGSLLVKHAIEYLQGSGVKTIGLYAYPNLVSFYSDLGFKQDEDFAVLYADKLQSMTAKTLPSVGRRQIDAVERFDSRCFGWNRRKLLESIIFEEGNLSYFIAEGPEVVGFVAATVYEKVAWIGPLVCQTEDAAFSLLLAVLSKLAGKTVYAVLPKKETALLDMLFRAGFREDFFVSRMFLGQTMPKNCICMAESLERG